MMITDYDTKALTEKHAQEMAQLRDTMKAERALWREKCGKLANNQVALPAPVVASAVTGAADTRVDDTQDSLALIAVTAEFDQKGRSLANIKTSMQQLSMSHESFSDDMPLSELRAFQHVPAASPSSGEVAPPRFPLPSVEAPRMHKMFCAFDPDGDTPCNCGLISAETPNVADVLAHANKARRCARRNKKAPIPLANVLANCLESVARANTAAETLVDEALVDVVSNRYHDVEDTVPPTATGPNIEAHPLCSICNDPMVLKEDRQALSCMHVFHGECLQSWAAGKGVTVESLANCPLNCALADTGANMFPLAPTATTEQTPICSICKETLLLEEKRQALPCMHVFHVECLQTWANMKGVHMESIDACPINCGKSASLSVTDITDVDDEAVEIFPMAASSSSSSSSAAVATVAMH
jgi:hypothetical protein